MMLIKKEGEIYDDPIDTNELAVGKPEKVLQI